MRDVHAFPRAELGDRPSELDIGDRVRGPRRQRDEAAGELVDTLGAAFEARDPALDAKVDRLVVEA